MTSARNALPTGRWSTLLSNAAENERFKVVPGATVFSGESENELDPVSANSSLPDAAFSVNDDLFSELAFGSMEAVVAASPWVASATSADKLAQLLPDLVCRLTTILP